MPLLPPVIRPTWPRRSNRSPTCGDHTRARSHSAQAASAGDPLVRMCRATLGGGHDPRDHQAARRPAPPLLRGARRPRRRDPRLHRADGVGDRGPPRLEPRRGRAHAGVAPGVRQPARRDPLGHRAPGLRAQARDRPSVDVQHAAPGRWAVGLSRAEPSQSTTSSRTATRRRSCRTRTAWRRPATPRWPRATRGRVTAGGTTHRRGDRRRVDDRRHGLRGAQQPRPQRPRRDHRAERQRPLVRADGVEPRRRASRRCVSTRCTCAVRRASRRLVQSVPLVGPRAPTRAWRP